MRMRRTFAPGAAEGAVGGRRRQGAEFFTKLFELFLVAGIEGFGVFFELFGGEPAGGGKVGGAGGFGQAVELAALLVHVFGHGPDGLEGAGGAEVFFSGADEVAVGRGHDIDDRLLDGRGFLFGARGAGKGSGGDLAGEEDFAGTVGGESAGKDSLSDLGGEELDGCRVFEKGDGDVGPFGTFGMAIVAVDEAIILSAEGAGAALDSVDAERAAEAVFFGGGRGCGGRNVGHEDEPFRGWGRMLGD